MNGEGVSSELVLCAAMLVRMANPHDTSLHAALIKAQERMFFLPWQIVGAQLEIASYSEPGVTRRTDGEVCTCPTKRGTCFHRAAWLILCTIGAASAGQDPEGTPFGVREAQSDDDRDLTDPTRTDYGGLDVDDVELTAPATAPHDGSRYAMTDDELQRLRVSGYPSGRLTADDLFNEGAPMATTKHCPKCGSDLVMRTTNDTGLPFLGCSNFPQCRYATDLPTSMAMRAMGAPELPLFDDPETQPGPEPDITISHCRSCRAEIVWGVTAAGKSCPYTVVDGKATTESHFITCPDRRTWRKTERR